MKIKEGYVPVPEEEYGYLRRLEGRIDAAQNFVDNQPHASIDEILDILLIDKSKLLKRKAEAIRQYEEELGHAGEN